MGFDFHQPAAGARKAGRGRIFAPGVGCNLLRMLRMETVVAGLSVVGLFHFFQQAHVITIYVILYMEYTAQRQP